MKIKILAFNFIFLFVISAFCNGNTELVNTQELDLNNIDNVRITYSSVRVFIYM